MCLLKINSEMKFNATEFVIVTMIHILLCIIVVGYYIAKNDDTNIIIFISLFYTSGHIVFVACNLIQDYKDLKTELEKYEENQDESTHNPITLDNDVQLDNNNIQSASNSFYAAV